MTGVISVSNFPEDKIYILLDKDYKKELIESSINKLKLNNYFELIFIINPRRGAKCKK